MKGPQLGDFLCCFLCDVIVSGVASKKVADLNLRWQLSGADFWLPLVGLADGLLLSHNIPQEYKPERRDARYI